MQGRRILLESFESSVNRTIHKETSEILSVHNMGDALPVITGGRLMRSALAYTARGAGTGNIQPLSVAMELVHASTLTHDDVMDRADKRRGEPTVNYLYDDSSAISVGNLLVLRGLSLAVAISPSYGVAFTDTLYKANVGQLKELRHRNKVMTINDYYEVVNGKTVAMLMLALRIGVDDPDLTDAHPLVKSTAQFGRAFQIVDDVDDNNAHHGDPTAHASKSGHTDISLGNYTLPTLYALQLAGINSVNLDRQDVDAIEKVTWDAGAAEALATARKHIVNAEEHMNEAMDSQEHASSARRLQPFFRNIADRLLKHSVDAAVVER